jgi:histidinol-phosphate aminotransferase
MLPLPIRPDLINRKPYGAPQMKQVLRLNTNENPYEHSSEFAQKTSDLLIEELKKANRYPDRDCIDLRIALAEYLNTEGLENLGYENLWPANGSNEILLQLFQLFGGPGRTAVGFEPSYSMHPIIASLTHTNWVSVPRNSEFELPKKLPTEDLIDASLILVCTPNNPTGNSTPLEFISEIHSATNGVVIVDEAYIEFSEQLSAVSLLSTHPRLAVVRTMSKAFGFAGVRLGYLVGSAELIEAMQLVRLPYHLSSITQATAQFALSQQQALKLTVNQIVSERNRVRSRLMELGMRVFPSDANFLLFGQFLDQKVAWEELVSRGVLVRDVGIPGWLRLTCGTPAENDQFLRAVSELTITNLQVGSSDE